MKKIIYILSLALIIASCKKVFQENPSDKYDEISVWKSLELVDAFINETYNGMGNWVTDGLALSSMTDDTYSMFNWAGERNALAGNMSPNNSGSFGVVYNKGSYGTGKWGYMYSKIRATNLFFKNIDNVIGDEDRKNRMKGEMHFLRAYFYAQLVNVFGEVPIFTKEFGLNDNFTEVTKSSYQDVSRFIVEECNAAIPLLLESYDAPGRVTKGAAMALKAEQLLYAASPLNNRGSYNTALLQEAKTAYEAIIDLGIYSLYKPSDYRSIFLDKNNSEIIFAKYTSGNFLIDRENSLERDIAPPGAGGYTAYCPLQNLVDEYEVINGSNTFLPATWDGTTRTVTTNPAYNDNDPYINRDPRFYASILYNGARRGNGDFIVESFEGGKDSRQSTTTAYWNATLSSYYLRKFSNEASDAYGDRPRTDVMWIHYRLGEIYLNLAEVLFELNTTDKFGNNALWYVNEIRSRAGMPTHTSIDQTKIRHERRIELAFEGNRFYDLRRWQAYEQALKHGQYGVKITPDGSGYTFTSQVVFNAEGKFDPRSYWWPIPVGEIEKNPTLRQSPGWEN
jgi:starch-binding outer membrane protein, SusD/RagB family